MLLRGIQVDSETLYMVVMAQAMARGVLRGHPLAFGTRTRGMSLHPFGTAIA